MRCIHTATVYRITLSALKRLALLDHPVDSTNTWASCPLHVAIYDTTSLRMEKSVAKLEQNLHPNLVTNCEDGEKYFGTPARRS